MKKRSKPSTIKIVIIAALVLLCLIICLIIGVVSAKRTRKSEIPGVPDVPDVPDVPGVSVIRTPVPTGAGETLPTKTADPANTPYPTEIAGGGTPTPAGMITLVDLPTTEEEWAVFPFPIYIELPEIEYFPAVTDTPTPDIKVTPAVTPKQDEKTTPAATPTSAAATASPTPTSTVDLTKLKAGDTFKFGAYEQDNNIENGKEPIEWIVLSNTNNELLVLSRHVLDLIKYNEEFSDITWADCSLRKWLNEDFFNTAFDEEEQYRIKTKELKNGDNPEYGTAGGKDTKDNVFLLSYSEAVNPSYGFNTDPNASDALRRCTATVYAAERGASAVARSNPEEGELSCIWWLRTPGYDPHLAMLVLQSGGINLYGYYGSYESAVAVRPALCIDLSRINLPTPTPTFTPTPTPISDQFVAKLKNLKTGDTFTFGSYEQDNNLNNGKEPIEWIVLSNENDALFVLSKYIIDIMAFDVDHTRAVTWSNSGMRKWLNGEFFETAFNGKEADRIKVSELKNPAGPNSRIEDDIDTQDKVFLLSYEECSNLEYGLRVIENGPGYRRINFSSDYDAYLTKAAKEKVMGSLKQAVEQNDDRMFWWHRTPCRVIHEDNSNIYMTYMLTSSISGGYLQSRPSFGVRPAIRIDLTEH